MIETLERALAPLLIIGSFCNLCMIEYPRGQPRAYLSYLYALAKWGFLIYFYYYQNLLWYSRENDIYMAHIISLVTITLILISFSRFKVQIFKCTPGSDIIILDLLVLLFFCVYSYF
ncbi:hypothetical protein ALC56_06912 [Trachymyrmex septentrionalis]|uniref:Uncharacterized protein n=1 Tax=Trachymyrmex septentrionalis TaxID=34720 RepID=A0A151JWZ7_9HYME|nr:hypothetical protein ALC56_06912 [Trachymyrmex septentrionalis]